MMNRIATSQQTGWRTTMAFLVGSSMGWALGGDAVVGQGTASPKPDPAVPIVNRSSVPSPLSPADSLNYLQLDPRQRIELVAHEPEVIDPVAIQFDDAGNLWVVEMRDYPNGPAEGQPPQGRIRVLEDSDLDGRYDRERVFADQLIYVNGLQLYRDGAFVTSGDTLWYLRDTDGDGRADKKEVWLGGFADQNPQLRANDPTIAFDLGLYVANGLRSQSVQPSSEQFKQSSPLDLRGRDVRLDLRSREVRTVTGPSQFGMTWDRLGNRYFCSNRNPCDTVLVEQEDIAMSPLAGLAPITTSVVPSGEASRVHPLTEGWTTSNLHAGQFSAACGVMVSASTQLPASDLGNALTCEPTGNLVHRRAIRRENGKSIVADEEPTREWLASRDGWFRPVYLTEGPDAAVYVVDMYRAVIEHPQFMPDELKNRPDLRYGDDRGRIYRVLSVDDQASRPIFVELKKRPIAKRSVAEWVDLLNHSNEWMRSTAARFLMDLEKPDSPTIQGVTQLARSGDRVEKRIRAAYLLKHWGQLDRSLLEAWLGSDEPSMQRIAWQLLRSESDFGPALVARYASSWRAAMQASDVDVAMAACWAVAAAIPASGENPAAEAFGDAVDRCLERNLASIDHPYLWMATTAACRDRLSTMTQKLNDRLLADQNLKLESLFRSKAAESVMLTVIERLVQMTAAPDDPTWTAMRREFMKSFSESTAQKSGVANLLKYQSAILSGWARSRDAASMKGDKDLWQIVLRLVDQPEVDPVVRKALVGLLAFGKEDQVVPTLRRIAESPADTDLFAAALRAWSKFADPELGGWIIERYNTASVQRRNELFTACLSSAPRSEQLVAAVEGGKLTMRAFSPSQVQSMKTIRFAHLRPRVEALIAKSVDANRAKVIETYTPCLDLTADLARGKQVFQQQCAGCHRIDAVGVNVGPDISDSRKYTPSQILISILDPNRAIDNNYFRFSVLTNDDQVVDGIVTEETATTVTLRGQNDKTFVLQRSDIASMKSTGISMMPEGLEAQIPPQAMADLIYYIKNWRYGK